MSTPYPHFDLDVYYPDSDGEPMAESDFQRKPLMYAVDALSIYFQSRVDVYVSGNMFIYYEQGNPKMVVAPDVFVVIGADKQDRSSYRLWQEPKAPDFVLEITSKSTRSEDQGSKRGIYAFLGVQEYWQFDPTGDYLRPPLQGLRLVDKNYQEMSTAIATGGVRAMRSEVLGLELRCEQDVLRFYDPITDTYLLSYSESEQARYEAEQARYEAEQAQHEAEQARHEAKQARHEAEQARREAEAFAERETSARQAAEDLIAELQAKLRALEARQDPE